MEIVNWCKLHGQDLLALLGGVVGIATLVVKLTPSPKDDKIVSKIVKILASLSLVNPDGSFIGKKQ